MVERVEEKNKFLRVYSSGQRGLTVNQMAYAYEGSNPSARIDN